MITKTFVVSSLDNIYLFTHVICIVANLCHTNSFGIGNTEQYANNGNLNGEYNVKTDLVNDYKCYVSGNNQIVHEDNILGDQIWVMYEGDTPVFYGTTETVCPRDVAWKYLPNGFNTMATDILPAWYIGVDGVPMPDIVKGKTGLDEECCASNNGPHLVFNTFTQICCADGTIRRIGNLC